MKRLALALSIIAIAAGCGGGSSPTSPSPATPTTTRAALQVTSLTAVGSKTATGYSYAVRVTVSNTGSAAATISNVDLTEFAAGAPFGTVALTNAFSAPVQAGTEVTSRAITLTDDRGQGYANRLDATVTYGDSVGTLVATKSADIAPLVEAPPPAPQGLVTLTGTVKAGGVAVSGAGVEIQDGPNAKKGTTTDSSGNYSISGLTAAAVTVRAFKSGYPDNDQRVTLTGSSSRLDFTLQGSSPTPTPTPTPTPPTPTAPDVRYVVLGVRANVITISNASEGVSQFSGVALPWSFEFSARSGQFLYVSAQNDLASGCIRVQIFKRGVLFKESESCGAYVIADASGSF